MTEEENDSLVEAKKRERLHQIKIDSILPTPRMNPIVISRESSVISLTSPLSSTNRCEASPAPTSTTTTTTTTAVFVAEEAGKVLSNAERHAIQTFLDESCNGFITKEDWMKQMHEQYIDDRFKQRFL